MTHSMSVSTCRSTPRSFASAQLPRNLPEGIGLALANRIGVRRAQVALACKLPSSGLKNGGLLRLRCALAIWPRAMWQVLSVELKEWDQMHEGPV